MNVYTQLNQWLNFRKSEYFREQTIGFVPTMGALHQGHLSLVKRSLAENSHTVVSIFLNPTQFNNSDDLELYPSSLEADIELLKSTGVDTLILPNFDDIYPKKYRYKVFETDFSKELCGKNRPGHFDGVLTVVMKLFNIVRPGYAYFGEKDHQQLVLIQDMVEDFFMNVSVVSCPTVRESDGLAMSSRNRRLTVKQRLQAPLFHTLLSSNRERSIIVDELSNAGFSVDYIEELKNRRYGAVQIGEVRLIDNVTI